MTRVHFARDGTLGRLVLDRADAHNAMDLLWVEHLVAAVDEVEAAAADGLRVLLLRAEGAAFCVGGDLHHIGGQLHRLGEELEAMIGPYHRTLERLAELPLPVVAAVQGPVAGGGIGLLWAADVVLATPQLQVVHGFAALGMSGDGGTSYYLPRIVGPHRALSIALQNRPVSAEEALAWGVVDELVDAGELRERAEALAARLAQGPTAAYAEMRRLYRTSLDRPLREQLHAELDAQRRLVLTADAREGIPAFAARRTPAFRGV